MQPSAPDPATDPAQPARDAHGFDPAEYDWVPVPRARRSDGWSPERQRAFLGLLADTGSVQRAARESGMSASSAYRLRRAPEGAAFAAAWEAAIQQAAHALVDAAFERAVHGSEEPVFDRTGRVIGRRFRQSDAMMMFLLRKHFPDRYGDLHRDRPEPAVPVTTPLPPPVADTLDRLGPVPPAGLNAPSDAALHAFPDGKIDEARDAEAAARDPVREHMARMAQADAPADRESDDPWGLTDDPEEEDYLEQIDDDDFDDDDFEDDDFEDDDFDEDDVGENDVDEDDVEDDDHDEDDVEDDDGKVDAPDRAESPDGGPAPRGDIP